MSHYSDFLGFGEEDQSKLQHMCHKQQITVKLKAASDHKNMMNARDDVQVVFSPIKPMLG